MCSDIAMSGSGRKQQAIEFYQDALKFKNYLTLPHQRLAAIYLKNARVDKAISQYEELTKENPDDVSVIGAAGTFIFGRWASMRWRSIHSTKRY